MGQKPSFIHVFFFFVNIGVLWLLWKFPLHLWFSLFDSDFLWIHFHFGLLNFKYLSVYFHQIWKILGWYLSKYFFFFCLQSVSLSGKFFIFDIILLVLKFWFGYLCSFFSLFSTHLHFLWLISFKLLNVFIIGTLNALFANSNIWVISI